MTTTGEKKQHLLARLSLLWLEACCWINSYSLLPFPTSFTTKRLHGAQSTFFSGLGGTQHLKDPAPKLLYDDSFLTALAEESGRPTSQLSSLFLQRDYHAVKNISCNCHYFLQTMSNS